MKNKKRLVSFEYHLERKINELKKREEVIGKRKNYLIKLKEEIKKEGRKK